jgi:hypothetical protein
VENSTQRVDFVPKHNQALNDKHWKALELIEAGQVSLKEISRMCGWSQDYMYELYEGKEKCGKIGELFQTELRKIETKNVSRIKTLTKENKRLALQLMNEYLRSKISKGSVSDEESKLISTVFNALAKATPNVEIGSMQWNYTKGLTAEELVHEFNKLRSIAEGASKRGAVSAAGSGSSRILPALTEPGS